ncbi:MAG: mandelate racemase/muconate lactonizing enzyme family protein [Chloroflexota bacterium]|nr:mandelate racemase/muconate lactonizing enzyme family protein [Chloroflexota bacterium]
MQITDVTLTPVYSRRETGIASPHVIVQLHTDEGLVGLGEMSDLGHGNYRFDLEDLRESILYFLEGEDPLDYGPLTRAARTRFPGGGPLREGIEIAIFDLVGKAKDQSIAEVLGGGYRDRIRVCYPIFRMFDMDEVEANVARVERRMNEGQDMFRLYCGGNVEADEAFLRAVRDRWGDEFVLKSLDLSGRLPWKKSLDVLRRLRPYEPMLAESVCDRRDPEGQYEVRVRTDLPISEHISSTQQAMDFAQNRWVDIYNVSLAGAGGFTNALRIAQIAQSAGISCLVGTTQELSIGVAAQAMFGAVLENLDYPSDMTGGLLYEDDVVVDRVQYENGYLLVPQGPGVGMTLDEDKLAALERPLSSLPVEAW